APALKPRTFCSTSSSAVCMMIGMNGSDGSALMRRATSLPSTRGIITSSTMTSGGESATIFSASAPSHAHSVTYPVASNRTRSTSRLSSLSSTIRTRGARRTSPSIASANESLHLAHDRLGLARLCEITVASDFHGFLAIRRQRMRGERDDRNATRFRIALEHLRRFPAVDHRNRNVHQDQIGLLCARLGDAFLAVQCLRDSIAEVLQNRGVHDSVVFVVFHEQHGFQSDAGHSCPRAECPAAFGRPADRRLLSF